MLAALFVAFMVVRVAFVEAFATGDPGRAAAVWPGHPTVALESGLAKVGDLAAAGRPIDDQLVDRLLATSRMAPLAPEPFLVRGVDAQVSGNAALALRAFLAARQRNPRAVAPRYFLADLYLQTGQTGPGLDEISSLARLVPQSLPRVAPYLAAFARAPNSAPQVKRILDQHPQLEAALLSELAADADQAKLALYLWSGRGGEEARPWQGRLLNQMVEAGRFEEARMAWARFTGISAEPGQLFDSEFSVQALPPFGWKLASGSSGIAEPQAGGRLHVLYYGRDNMVLASQLLTLPPGRYRLSMEVSASSPASKSMSWTIRCLPASTAVAAMALERSGSYSAPFTISSGACPAQVVELAGTASEFPERAEVTISRLQLQRGPAR